MDFFLLVRVVHYFILVIAVVVKRHAVELFKWVYYLTHWRSKTGI